MPDTSLTPEQLAVVAEVRAADEKRTKGPWISDVPPNWLDTAARVRVDDPYGLIATVDMAGWRPKSVGSKNADFIAAAGTHTTELLAIIADLDKRVTAAEKYKPIAPPVECELQATVDGQILPPGKFLLGMTISKKRVRGVFIPLEVRDE